MNRIFISIFMLLFLTACKNNNEESAGKIQTSDTVSKAEQIKKESTAFEDADISQEEIAGIDMGAYIFRVHDVRQYKPGETQSKLMKMDDAVNDYFILDCSIESKSEAETDTGVDMANAWFELGDGSIIKYSLRSSAILGSFNTENNPRFPKQHYEMMWSSKFPAGVTARSHLFALEVPQGATLSGVGFYKDNPAKNKYSKLRN